MNVVGYQLQTKDGITGETGVFFDYLIGSNGVFIRVKNRHIEATIPIAEAEIRGLAPAQREIKLVHGKIPRRIYDLALSMMTANYFKENELLITWTDSGYLLEQPPQEGKEAHVEYELRPDTVIDIHNHTGGLSFFSDTDNTDDRGFKISMVLNRVEEIVPEYVMRLAVYGYFCEMDFEEVFE